MTLPNGNSIDLGMLETAMEDSDPSAQILLESVTGEVVFFQTVSTPPTRMNACRKTSMEAMTTLPPSASPPMSLPVDGRFRTRNGRTLQRTRR